MGGRVGGRVGGFLVIEMAENLTLFCPAEHVHHETNQIYIDIFKLLGKM